MKLHVIFGQREERYEGQYAPESLDCWDEYSVEENPDGFEEAIKKHRDSKEFVRVEVVKINVNGKQIRDILNPQHVIAGTIEV